MLRRWYKIAVGIFAIFVLMFGVSFFFPAEYQICGPNEYTHAKECSQYYLGPFVLAWIVTLIDAHNGFVAAIAAIFVAGFTGTLWWAADGQYDLLENQIKLARDEFNATHRAKIRVAYIKMTPLQLGIIPSAEIWAINVGDSDAEITDIGADIFLRRIDRAGTAVMQAEPVAYPGIPVITPGEQANISIRGRAILGQPQIDGIYGKNGSDPWLHLCTVGTIHYFDANRTHRVTSFFRIYNPQRLRFMKAPEDDEYAEWDYEA